MNRFSVLFAVVLAASFTLESGTPNEPATEQTSAALVRNRHNSSAAPGNRSSTGKVAGAPGVGNAGRTKSPDKIQDPEAAVGKDAKDFLDSFFEKSSLHKPTKLKLMFATLPDPIETHLASAFDHDVSALQDGIEDSNYLFDSSWIPWETSTSYDALADSLNAKTIREKEHEFPGLLLFRKANDPHLSTAGIAYDEGMIVVMLAEKPTEGISIKQTQHAVELLKDIDYPFAGPLRILGPTFSGSFPSLVSVTDTLKQAYPRSSHAPLQVLIRSGGFTGTRAAQDMLAKTALDDVVIDAGSSEHSNDDEVNLILEHVKSWHIDSSQVAFLAENESSFGRDILAKQADPWKVSYPRDISALRTVYEKQGILERVAPAGSAQRSLQLKDEEEHEGDTIKGFGDQRTVAAEESVLFGIADFLKSHGIRVVAIAATNEADRYFLSEFVHANVSGVRVVIVGSSRLFMRGSTSQFWGDMMVSSFPLLPRIYEWTGGETFGNPASHRPRIFADDFSQGTYIATRDLWAEDSVRNLSKDPFPNYGQLLWDSGAKSSTGAYPPVYLTALGAGSVWPVASDEGCPIATETAADSCPPKQPNGAQSPPQPEPPKDLSGAGFLLRMPVPFARHFAVSVPLDPISASKIPSLDTATNWQVLFWLLIGLATVYCIGVLYANPVLRSKFAYLYPVHDWEHWSLLVVVPCLLCQFAFLALARSNDFRFGDIPGSHRLWWWAAEIVSILLPGMMLLVSWYKAGEPNRKRNSCSSANHESAGSKQEFHPPYTIGSLCLAFVLIVIPIVCAIWFGIVVQRQGISGILNTYREMHWESGLSLLPTSLLLLAAILCWTYQTLVGINLLEPRPCIAHFPEDERIGDARAESIANSGKPFPRGRGTRSYWWTCLAAVLVMILSWAVWAPFRRVSTLEPAEITWTVMAISVAGSVLIFLDLVQFVWLWSALRGLLQALNRQKFRRSFVPIQDFNWRNVWSFSGGSFHERRQALAAQVECLFNLAARHPDLEIHEYESNFRQRRIKYSKHDLSCIAVAEYKADLRQAYKDLSEIGDKVAAKYAKRLREEAKTEKSEQPAAQVIVNCGDKKDGSFEEEARAVEKLPRDIHDYECFLCLLYVGFMQCILGRLRTLAISVVSVFSAIALAFAVYPFRPMQPLTLMGMMLFVVIAISMFLVFSQMDKDPVLGRILQSDPSKLEWSFYGKFIETLTPPLLTLLSSLLPGGAGRLLSVVQSLFGHGQ